MDGKGHLLKVVISTFLVGCAVSFELIKQPTGCSFPDGQVLENTCRLKTVYKEESTKCNVSCSALHNGEVRVGNGSVCWHLSEPSVLFLCKRGMWTSAAHNHTVIHRQKRNPLAVGAVVAILCFMFCRRGKSNTPPRFTDCENKSVTVEAENGRVKAVATWEPPKATDSEDKQPSVKQVYGSPPGSEFQEGTNVVTYLAQDTGGLIDYCWFHVIVTVTSCDLPDYIAHGRLKCIGDRPNVYGSLCTYSCDTGYEINGSATIWCEKNTKWNAPFPSCLPVECIHPENMTVPGADIQCQWGYTYQDVCSISCKKGYVHTGSTFIQCKENRKWTVAYPCIDNEPPMFPNGCPPNQQISSGPLGSAVEVTWDDPEVTDNSGLNVTIVSDQRKNSLLLPGFHVMRITARDQSNNVGQCNFVIAIKVGACQPIFPPSNSRLTCPQGYMEGAECRVSCDTGYELQGEAVLRCLKTEQWDNILPTCTAVPCPEPDTVAHGTFDSTKTTDFQFQDFCVLTCDSGFRVRRPAFIQCLANGTWSLAGTCLDIEKPVFEDCPSNVEVTANRLGANTTVTWVTPVATDNSGEFVNITFNIAPGSLFKVGLTYVTYVATDLTGNSATCRFSVTVTTLQCPVPDLERANRTRTLMVYNCPEGYIMGASCTVQCTQGFPLVGPNVIVCERDNSSNPPRMFWAFPKSNNVVPECRENVCPALTPPANGALSCFFGNFGWDCMMSCNAKWDVPFTFDGHFYCTNSNGFWIPSTVQNCTVAIRPGKIKLLEDFYYFTGTCEMSKEYIKHTFILRMNNSTYFRDACYDVQLCTVENVQVFCGEIREKRSAEKFANMRHRRSATHYVVISFEITFSPNETHLSEQQEYQALLTRKDAIYEALNKDLKSGHFEIANLTTDDYSITPPSLVPVCPPGTGFKETLDTNKMSCRGCGSGFYMNFTSCEACPVGFYSSINNATSCTQCPEGWTTRSTASKECVEVCKSGYISIDGFAPCRLCPPGQYQPNTGSTRCNHCPGGKWTMQAGSTNMDQCVLTDLHFVNTSVTLDFTTPWTSMSMVMWFQLDENTACLLTLHSEGEEQKFIMYAGASNILNSTRNSISSMEVTMGSWSRLVITQDLSSGKIQVFHKDYLILSQMSQLPVNTTKSYVQISIVGKGIVSGLHAVNRTLTQLEINDTRGSCSFDPYETLLLWTNVSQSMLYMPTQCDPLDECISNPCNNQTCYNLLGGFQCRCLGGWKGATCNIPPDLCDLNECRNGATCLSGRDNYTCVCLSNFTGSLCEAQIVDGAYGQWSSWSLCSVTCGGGKQERQRVCNEPPPSNGGKNCSGPDTESKNCSVHACAVDGGWSPWESWGVCSTSCGGGEQTRFRTCDNPSPSNGGLNCTGNEVDIQACSVEVCPVDGQWGLWSEWGPCSVSCGKGIQERSRACDHPVPALGGKVCDGSSNETISCNYGQCPACPQLIRSPHNIVSCNTTKEPYLQTCIVTCTEGYSLEVTNSFYVCGNFTNYLWNFQTSASSVPQLPLCLESSTPLSASMNFSTNLDARCDENVAFQVQSTVKKNLDILPCYQNDCQFEVNISCSDHRKRSAGSMVVTVHMSVSFGNESLLLTENDTDAKRKFFERFKAADEAAAMIAINNTLEIFTVKVGSQIIQPDISSTSTFVLVQCTPGTSQINAICVNCRLGTKEIKGECIPCPVGQYQDEPGSVSCKSCPAGLSTELPGAYNISQCMDISGQSTSTDNAVQSPTAITSTSDSHSIAIQSPTTITSTSDSHSIAIQSPTTITSTSDAHSIEIQSPTTITSSSDSHSNDNVIPIIIGVVVGAVVGVALILLICFLLKFAIPHCRNT